MSQPWLFDEEDRLPKKLQKLNTEEQRALRAFVSDHADRQCYATKGEMAQRVLKRLGIGTDGRYLLIDDDRLVVDARMQRPQDGKVADDGTFILNDWGDSDALSGTFYAFRSDRPALDYSLEDKFIDRRLGLRDEVQRGTLYVIQKALGKDEQITGLTDEERPADFGALLH